MLLGLRDASLVAPLTRGGAALYHATFRGVMGDAAYRTLLGDVDLPGERWPGELEEVRTEARRKVRSGRPKKLAA